MALRASPNRSHSAVEDTDLSAVALGGDGSLSVVVGVVGVGMALLGRAARWEPTNCERVFVAS
jgi:hypothetical protein